MSSTPPPSDKGAAFTGLIVTAVLLFLMSFGIVKWTNAKFASHEGAKAEATTAH
ncbi:MAG: hypothetical protein IPF98_07225 [Gemmatimonadetes bacterium]|nr:hypothetical protein [Gemmatimonadota bacterium]MCC6772232.1 hypothetical protein [Gemmatimonadaceae bacterium]